ncbi:MAG: hypothetical protein IKH95_06620 [Bacteroidaceae bacterium]|nr:hypothetical protein [Bacteroidaceae bacterium]
MALNSLMYTYMSVLIRNGGIDILIITMMNITTITMTIIITKIKITIIILKFTYDSNLFQTIYRDPLSPFNNNLKQIYLA